MPAGQFRGANAVHVPQKRVFISSATRYLLQALHVQVRHSVSTQKGLWVH